MYREDFEKWETIWHDEVRRLEALGDYSPEAPFLRKAAWFNMALCRHMKAHRNRRSAIAPKTMAGSKRAKVKRAW